MSFANLCFFFAGGFVAFLWVEVLRQRARAKDRRLVFEQLERAAKEAKRERLAIEAAHRKAFGQAIAEQGPYRRPSFVVVRGGKS